MSKGALDRLGERLALHGQIPEDDTEEFAAVADAYQDTLDQVEQHLADLGFAASTRVKTTGVLIEKLRRESSRLSQVQDLAGARIVLGDRRQQNEAVERIKLAFDQLCPKSCKVKDRREDPSHGYRAVHVIAFLDGIPVEIQVRTELQDVWAQILERLADQWGRGIRYGDAPENPEVLVRLGDGEISRRELLKELGKLSELINIQEQARLVAYGVEERCRSLEQRLSGIWNSISEVLEAQLAGRADANLLVPDDAWEALVQLYQNEVTKHGRGSDLPITTRSFSDAQALVTAIRESYDALAREIQAQVDQAEAETRRILTVFAEAAEGVHSRS